MIKIKHPDPKCNQQQEAMIAQAPDHLKRFHELLFTHGNITYRYHDQAHRLEPTEADWQEYLEGCDPGFRKVMEETGFEKGRRVLHFTRYIMEKKGDVGLDEYVRRHMDPEDYAEYMAMLNRK